MEDEKIMASLRREALEAKMNLIRVESERDALREELEIAYRELAEARKTITFHSLKEEEEVLALKKTRKESMEPNHTPESTMPPLCPKATLNTSGPHPGSTGDSLGRRGFDVWEEDSHEVWNTTCSPKGDADVGIKEKLRATAMVLQGVATTLLVESKPMQYSLLGEGVGELSSSAVNASFSLNPVERIGTPPSLRQIFSEMEENLTKLLSYSLKEDGVQTVPGTGCRTSMHLSFSSSFSASSFSTEEEGFFSSSPFSLLDAILEALISISRFFSDEKKRKEGEEEKGEDPEAIHWFTTEQNEDTVYCSILSPSAVTTSHIKEGTKHQDPEAQVELRVMTPVNEKGSRREEVEQPKEGWEPPKKTMFKVPAIAVSGPCVELSTKEEPFSASNVSFSPLQLASPTQPTAPASPSRSSSRSRSRNGSEDSGMESGPSPFSDPAALYSVALYRVAQAYGGIVRDVKDLLFQRRILQQQLQALVVERQLRSTCSSDVPAYLYYTRIPRSSGTTIPVAEPALPSCSPPLLWWRVRVIVVLAVRRFLRLVASSPSCSREGRESAMERSLGETSCAGSRECVRLLLPLRSAPTAIPIGAPLPTVPSTHHSATAVVPPSSSCSSLPQMVLRIRLPSSSFADSTVAHGPPSRGVHPPLPSTRKGTFASRETASPGDGDGVRSASPDPITSLCSIMRSDTVRSGLEKALEKRGLKKFCCSHAPSTVPVLSKVDPSLPARLQGNDDPMLVSSSSSFSLSSPPPCSWCEQRRREAEAAQIYSVLLVLQQVIESGRGDTKGNNTTEQEEKWRKEDGHRVSLTLQKGKESLSLVQRLGLGLADYLKRHPSPGAPGYEKDLSRSSLYDRVTDRDPSLSGGSVLLHARRTGMHTRGAPPASSTLAVRRVGSLSPPSPLPLRLQHSASKLAELETLTGIAGHLSERDERLKTPSPTTTAGRQPLLFSTSTVRYTASPTCSSIVATDASRTSMVIDTSDTCQQFPCFPTDVEHWSEQEKREEDGSPENVEKATLSGLFAQEVLEVIHALDEHISSALSRCPPSPAPFRSRKSN